MMIRKLFVVLALAAGGLAVAPGPADAEVSYNECFSMCHEAAMSLYLEFDSLSFASLWFDGCMATHCTAA